MNSLDKIKAFTSNLRNTYGFKNSQRPVKLRLSPDEVDNICDALDFAVEALQRYEGIGCSRGKTQNDVAGEALNQIAEKLEGK